MLASLWWQNDIAIVRHHFHNIYTCSVLHKFNLLCNFAVLEKERNFNYLNKKKL